MCSYPSNRNPASHHHTGAPHPRHTPAPQTKKSPSLTVTGRAHTASTLLKRVSMLQFSFPRMIKKKPKQKEKRKGIRKCLDFSPARPTPLSPCAPISPFLLSSCLGGSSFRTVLCCTVALWCFDDVYASRDHDHDAFYRCEICSRIKKEKSTCK